MTLMSDLDMLIPILYINPSFIRHSGVIETVSRSGGLGIFDCAATERHDFTASTPYGLRIAPQDLSKIAPSPNLKLIVVPYESLSEFIEFGADFTGKLSLPVIAEVGSVKDAGAAKKAGASALIARGNEGPGWVSETGGFVLLQELKAAVDLPVFLRGGVSLRTAKGAVAAGASGIVLDMHFVLTEDGRLSETERKWFTSLSTPSTTFLAEMISPVRVYSRVATASVKRFRSIEQTLLPENHADYINDIKQALVAPVAQPDKDDGLIAISEDAAISSEYVKKYGSAEAIISEFAAQMKSFSDWPLSENSSICSRHSTRFPIVQGPMAHVSDNPDFLAEVAKAGALPVLAMGNMPPQIAAEGLALAREKTGGNFGVGLIGLDINQRNYDAHLALMKDNPPPFAVLAAGNPELASRIEKMGMICYLHCPAPGILSEALKTGLRHFVFEGSESGGHIGLLGSLNLWSANLAVLEKAAQNGLDLSETTILFAGGIATGRAAAFVGGMIADLAAKGLKVGLQIGTAYLSTEEIVSTCATTSCYRDLILKSENTVIIGRTVNIKARAAKSPMAAQLIEREFERIRAGIGLTERKELYEKDNLGALRLASKGCAIDPATATWDCPVFCDLTTDEQMERGLYLMGQAVSLLREPVTINDLHKMLVEDGRRIYLENTAQQAVPELVEKSEVDITTEAIHENELIAVVGLGLRLPGSSSPEEYWDQILSGRSGVIEVPKGRWANLDFYYNPDPKVPDKTYTKIGGFLPDFTFDPLRYRIPPSVAKKMDRTQQMAVTCAADALADAGLSPEKLKGKKVGTILGNSMGGETTDLYAERVSFPKALSSLRQSLESLNLDRDTSDKLLKEFESTHLAKLPDITEDSLPGELANVISGRVANVFNLEGPNFTVDAACASSIAAVMNAVAALRSGAIEIAVTGGVDAAMHPSSFVKFCKIGALSADGSRPFDEGANGFIMGEGAGVLILKKMSDAVRDGDRIYATIVETGSSSDGRGKGITAPNAAGQVRALRACFEASNIDPKSVGLVEAHGTSTAVGDKTELEVLDRFFRDAGAKPGAIGVGSVKSQLGHLKAAAGAAGMIKAILSVNKKTLPPTINCENPKKCIDWESSPLFLVKEPHPWTPENGYPRRVGVSAFGFGGTNFHILIQEHNPNVRVITRPRAKIEAPIEITTPNWPKPDQMNIVGESWVLGADSPVELAAKLDAARRDLNGANHSAIAATYRHSAGGFNTRVAFSAPDAETAKSKLDFIAEVIANPAKAAILPTRGIYMAQGAERKSARGIAFIFPGQGSQYPFMLRDLAERYPIVAETLQEADDILQSLGVPRVTDGIFPKSAALRPESQGDPMKDTQYLQPMILAANAAIFRLLAQFNVHPAACAGHSLGEYAACVAAGVFSFRDALEAVAVRGREMARVSIADPGLMMSIPADARVVEEVLTKVDGYVVAANKNSPKQTVISGETAAVKKAGELFKARGLDGILIPVSAAFHSGVVAPAREPFMKTLEKLTVNQPTVPVISNVTGEYYPTDPGAPDKIRDLLGKQFAAPVEWVKTLRKLYNDGIRIFLECGPKRVMTNLCLDTLSKDVAALPTNHPKKGGIAQLLETLAVLSAEGVPVDFSENKPRPVVVSKPDLRIVSSRTEKPAPEKIIEFAPNPLEALLDDELKEIAKNRDFARYLDLQGEPVRQLLKSSFDNFVKTVLPLEKTVRQVNSEGMTFDPVVVSGIAAGLPTDVRFPFDKETLDDLILGRNFIKKVPESDRRRMLEKNVERLIKGPHGEADLRIVENMSGVIKLAGFFAEGEVLGEYGLDERLIRAMDVTTKLAVAAGIEALRDAGIPLVRKTRTTSTGHELPDSWSLAPELRAETGIIFASAFPGMASLVDEVTRHTAATFGSGAKKRLIDFYSGMVSRIDSDRERENITRWFTDEFSRLNPAEPEEIYTFNRDFLLRVMSMAHGQLAQLIKAQGPNTHIDAACAGTTQAIVMARDWIRSGQAKRVIVIAADDVAGNHLFPWVGSGFLAMGAATTSGNVSEAALPFDDRRHGLILGSAAAGVIVERSDLVKQRGMDPIAVIEAGMAANSGFHGTRLDVEHISEVMESMISKWEVQTGGIKSELAKKLFFMSHETYSPKRGGSSAAEVHALRKVFGDNVGLIPIANTKGFTGHTMGVGVEDIVALRCLQTKMLPPIPNLKHPDPEFADLNLSKGGPVEADYALRLAAGFGSQIVVALYKAVSRNENRISDFNTNREWLRKITGYSDPVISVENRTLRVTERVAVPKIEQPSVVAAVHQAAIALPVEQPQKMAVGAEQVREKILALLSEKTGYPPDMLDTNLDLEADLGIDTVKQAEFISEIRDTFEIPRIEGLKIAEFPTIEHIINFVLEHTSEQAGTDVDVQQSAATEPNEAVVREKILELLSAKTGYPADMLDTELDLEADLGIDTVKQAEFISEIRDIFEIPRIEGLKIAEFPTINHIIRFVVEKTQSAAPVSPQTIDPTSNDDKSPARADIRLYETKLVSVGKLAHMKPPAAEKVFIVGGAPRIREATQAALEKLGYAHIELIAGPELPDQAIAGVINLLAFDMKTESVQETFRLYMDCAAKFETGPAFMITPLREDGGFGFVSPAINSDEFGSMAGASKSFSKEYPETLTRVIDIHPDHDIAACADVIVRSLIEEFPLESAFGKDGALRSIRLTPAEITSGRPAVQKDEVVMVTGGARGITALCLKELAKDTPLTFVILARTAPGAQAAKYAAYGESDWAAEKLALIERLKRSGKNVTPVAVEKELSGLKSEAEVFRTIAELKTMGSEVIYRSVDIRDAEAVDSIVLEVGELCGRIDVIVHGAGVDMSKTLKSKTMEQIDTVMSVKVQGFKNIIDALNKHEFQPRRIVGFGSVSGRFGNLAQIDYSAANDALAHMIRRINAGSDARATIIDWAPWAEIGMATRGGVQQTLEAAGIDFIPPEIGAQIFALELRRTSGSSEVAAVGKIGPFASDAFADRDEGDFVPFTATGMKGRILELEPHSRVRALISLDPSKPVLNDHRINRAAVFPGVGALELMRTAAYELADAAEFMGFESVQFKSPLKVFKEEPFDAEVEVTKIESPAGDRLYKGRIFSWLVDKKGARFGDPRIHHEAVIRFGPREKAYKADYSEWTETIWTLEHDIYEAFFHGPAFRYIDQLSIDGSGKSIRFMFKDTPETAEMFVDITPAAIETVFQAAAGLSLEMRGVMALPVGVDRAVIYDGAMDILDGEINLISERQEGPEARNVFTYNCIVRNGSGEVVIELQGFSMMELQPGAGFAGKVFEQFVNIPDVSANSKAPDFLGQILSVPEIQKLSEFPAEKRAGEWLAGRVAAKKCVQRLTAALGKNHDDLTAIVISADTLGKPFVEGEAALSVDHISISHSHQLAGAALANSGAFMGLGMDIERVESRSESWISDYFADEEIELAGQGNDKWTALTKFWTLKEAVLKALGSGLRFDLREVVIKNVSAYGKAEIEFRNDILIHAQTIGYQFLEARVNLVGSMAIAKAVLYPRA